MSELKEIGAKLRALHADGAPLTTALRWLVDACGSIEPERIPELAHIYNLSRAEVSGVISFYADFTQAPAFPGHLLRICQAEACQAVGSRALTDHARATFGVELGEASPDGVLRLVPVYCLGLCACGPAIELDGHAHGHVDDRRLDALIASVREAPE